MCMHMSVYLVYVRVYMPSRLLSIIGGYLDGKTAFSDARQHIFGAECEEGCGKSKRLAGDRSRSQIIKGLNSILRNLDPPPLRSMVNL